MQGTKNLTQGSIKRQLFNLALPIMGTSFYSNGLQHHRYGLGRTAGQ